MLKRYFQLMLDHRDRAELFENLLREIKKLDGHKVSIPIETDENGYINKECPSGSCKFKFKVHAENWKDIFRDETVYCPLYRHEAKADSWWTTERVEHAKRQLFRGYHDNTKIIPYI